jgi:hypothetical protein
MIADGYEVKGVAPLPNGKISVYLQKGKSVFKCVDSGEMATAQGPAAVSEIYCGSLEEYQTNTFKQ